MDTGTASLLISTIATLSGVAITAIFAELRERRRSYLEERRIERSERQDHLKWLRQERRLLYAVLVQSAERSIEQYGSILDGILLDNSLAGNVNPHVEQRVLMENLFETSREVARCASEVQMIGSADVLGAANAVHESLDAVLSLLRHMNEATPRVEADAFIRTSQVWIGLRESLDQLLEAARADLGSPWGSLDPNP